MPPRISIYTCLRASKPLTTATSQFTLPIRPFSTTPNALAKQTSRPKKKVSHDPYIREQQARKKAAFFARKGELKTERLQNLGDPVRGTTTPFVESFAPGAPLRDARPTKAPEDSPTLNYALTPNNVSEALSRSVNLAVVRQIEKPQDLKKPFYFDQFRQPEKKPEASVEEEDPETRRQKDHERATEAIKRITLLDNGSSKDRMRVNIARCVATFGRHNTDQEFPPRAPPLNAAGKHEVRPATNSEATKKRIGLDTGSSEVQIAILTAKIKTVADFLTSRGKKDKHNKRNLRLLVHRRQKLLQYLRRKERGGPRWQHCIETLGLTEGTWRGEISL
ncbi:hypothetical protein B0J11DRAFT_482448 [Dendryphion nanum]|uniref:Ribosomal protein S15 n=1 Tax=Dendryphion nanum TaxID=256645 RepID=A0A9P9E550_9PLEO|nr:hypothetical protein B0J11DRAFT_482448 [Dendryphion nanum]